MEESSPLPIEQNRLEEVMLAARMRARAEASPVVAATMLSAEESPFEGAQFEK